MEQPHPGISNLAVKLLFHSSMGELSQSACDDAPKSISSAFPKAAAVVFVLQIISQTQWQNEENLSCKLQIILTKDWLS